MPDAVRSVPSLVPQRRRRLCVGRGALTPNRPTCTRCKERERVGKLSGKSTRLASTSVTAAAIPPDRGDDLRGQPHPAAHLVAGDHPDVVQQEGHQHQPPLPRTLRIGLKAAWFLLQRIREAMRGGDLSPMSGNGGIVEADETYPWRGALGRCRHELPSWRQPSRMRKERGEVPVVHDQRKLVAVLAADVVGYSRLMGRDESGTLARLRAHRRNALNQRSPDSAAGWSS